MTIWGKVILYLHLGDKEEENQGEKVSLLGH